MKAVWLGISFAVLSPDISVARLCAAIACFYIWTYLSVEPRNDL